MKVEPRCTARLAPLARLTIERWPQPLTKARFVRLPASDAAFDAAKRRKVSPALRDSCVCKLTAAGMSRSDHEDEFVTDRSTLTLELAQDLVRRPFAALQCTGNGCSFTLRIGCFPRKEQRVV
jgi:hypothetical protein